MTSGRARASRRHRAAHREPGDVRAADVEVVEQRRGVARHVGHAERAVRQALLADAAVIDDGQPVAIRERLHLGVPGGAVVAEAAQQQDVVAAAVLDVVGRSTPPSCAWGIARSVERGEGRAAGRAAAARRSVQLHVCRPPPAAD